MRSLPIQISCCLCLLVGGCEPAVAPIDAGLPLPIDASVNSQTPPGSAPDAGGITPDCTPHEFQVNHPWAQTSGVEVIYVRAGGTHDGRSPETPRGDLPPLHQGDTPLLLLMAAPQAHEWQLSSRPTERSITLIGSCEGHVILRSANGALIDQRSEKLRLASLQLHGSPEAQALLEVSGNASIEAQKLKIQTTGRGHGIQIRGGGDIHIVDVEFGAIDGHAIRGWQATGSWTLEDNTFLGPIGMDGVSIVNFRGSGFSLTRNQFEAINGNAVDSIDSLGSWTLEDNTFRGPIGTDGVNIVDFSGSGFRVSGSHFEAINGKGLDSTGSLGSWTLEDNTFRGPIGNDGISVIDFGGSTFHVATSTFHHVDGSSVDSQGAVGSWTLEDNTFRGPIGDDGVSIVDFSGSGFRVAGNSLEVMGGSGVSAREIFGSWTLEDNTFLGPIGTDGISIDVFYGDELTVTGNTISGVTHRGIRVARSRRVTIANNNISYGDRVSPGGPGIRADSFMEPGDTLTLSNNQITGARHAGVHVDGMLAAFLGEGNTVTMTRGREQGGLQSMAETGFGVLVTASAAVSLQNNSLSGNASAPILIDLNDWGRNEDLTLAGEGIIALRDNTYEAERQTLIWYRPPEITVDSNAPVQDLSNRCPPAPDDQDCEDEPEELPAPVPRDDRDRVGCGDGMLQTGESCDDRNDRRGDGCDGSCRQETDRDQLVPGQSSLLFLGQWPENDFPAEENSSYRFQMMGQGPSLAGELGVLPNARNTERPLPFPHLTRDEEGPGLRAAEVVSLHSGIAGEQIFAITKDQRVYGWGRNQLAQTTNTGVAEGQDCPEQVIIHDLDICALGAFNEGCDAPSLCQLEPVLVRGLSDVLLASAGANHSCFYGVLEGADPGRRIYCMGLTRSALGQVPNPEAQTVISPLTEVALPQNRAWIALESGVHHSCALNDRGEVWCWGRNMHFQLGYLELGGAPNATFVIGPTALGPVNWDGSSEATAQIRRLAVGGAHACAIGGPGELYCWGTSLSGANGTSPNAFGGVDPRRVNLRHEAVDLREEVLIDVSSGELHTCAVSANGPVICFGDNQLGQLGTETPFTWQNTPGVEGAIIEPPEGKWFTRVRSGANYSCAQVNTGHWTCWGDNRQRALAPHRQDTRINEPISIPARN